jgi:hypothetical protein
VGCWPAVAALAAPRRIAAALRCLISLVLLCLKFAIKARMFDSRFANSSREFMQIE